MQKKSEEKIKEDNFNQTIQGNDIEEGIELYPKSEFLYSWKTKEYIKYDKTKNWYIMGGIVLVFLVAVSFWPMKNPIMGLTFVLAAAVYLLYAKREPRIIGVKLHHGGILVDDTFYDYEEMESFWIFYNTSEDAYVSIRRHNSYLPYIQIPLGAADPSKVRNILLNYIDEKKQKEEIANVIEKIFKI